VEQTTHKIVELTKMAKTKAPKTAKSWGLLKAACVQVLMLFYLASGLTDHRA
jgi:hypothetical protein